MQTYKDGEIQGFEMGEASDLSEKMMKGMKDESIDRAVISKMPNIGDHIAINGIHFTVQTITKSGNVILEPMGKN